MNGQRLLQVAWFAAACLFAAWLVASSSVVTRSRNVELVFMVVAVSSLAFALWLGSPRPLRFTMEAAVGVWWALILVVALGFGQGQDALIYATLIVFALLTGATGWFAWVEPSLRPWMFLLALGMALHVAGFLDILFASEGLVVWLGATFAALGALLVAWRGYEVPERSSP